MGGGYESVVGQRDKRLVMVMSMMTMTGIHEG